MIVLRERFLLLHGADPARWAKRHGLEPFATPCRACGAERRTTIPFAVGSLRGLLADDCACGDGDTVYCVVRAAGRGDLLDAEGGAS